MRRLVIALGMSVLVASACSLLPQLETPTPMTPTLVPPTPAPTVDPASPLGRAQAAWAAAGIRNYTWTIPNGVPARLGMDFDLNAIDDELSFGRTSFDPAP